MRRKLKPWQKRWNRRGAYFVPAFSGLFAPYWRREARGVIVGLTRYITPYTLQGRYWKPAPTKPVRLWMPCKDSGVELNPLEVDGGMRVNEVLMQFQSDILNVPVIRPRVAETTALGAAYAAGLAVGFWSGLDELRQNWTEDKSLASVHGVGCQGKNTTVNGKRRWIAPLTGWIRAASNCYQRTCLWGQLLYCG